MSQDGIRYDWLTSIRRNHARKTRLGEEFASIRGDRQVYWIINVNYGTLIDYIRL